jgi:hypothetical protein
MRGEERRGEERRGEDELPLVRVGATGADADHALSSESGFRL